MVPSRINAKSDLEAEKLRDGSSGAPVVCTVRDASAAEATTVVVLLLEAVSRDKAGEKVRLDSLRIAGRPWLGNAVAAFNASANELDLGGVLDFIAPSWTMADRSLLDGSLAPKLYIRLGIGLIAVLRGGLAPRFDDAGWVLPSEDEVRRGEGGRVDPLVTVRESAG